MSVFTSRFAVMAMYVLLGVSSLHAGWIEAGKVLADDGAAGDNFGYSVAIDGDYAVVGSRDEDEDADGLNPLPDAGSAYIFVRSGSTWSQQQKLVASDRAAADLFGGSVAISGDTVVVGAYLEDEDANGLNALSSAGSVYVFTRNGTTWSQQQKLVAADRSAVDYFGVSVAISGDTVIVGATGEDEDGDGLNPLNDAGSAYVFVRSGTTWSQQQKLAASDREASDHFGSVAISGDTVIVGASGEDEDANGFNMLSSAGSAYIFTRSGTAWSQQQKLVASDRAESDNFGIRVAISADTAIVGAYLEDEDANGLNTLSSAGSAYVFMRSGSTWNQQQKLVASDRTAGDTFGYYLAISGDTAVIGATQADTDAQGQNPLTNAGSAYIFTRSGTMWSQQQKLTASDRGAGDLFGGGVAVSGSTVIAGAYGQNGVTGAAYLFAVDAADAVSVPLFGPFVYLLLASLFGFFALRRLQA